LDMANSQNPFINSFYLRNWTLAFVEFLSGRFSHKSQELN
jgi:hypothetical protein